MSGDRSRDAARWARLVDLFEAASRLPATERPSFVARVCGDDAALRIEVESLLEAARPFLDDGRP